MTPFHAQAKALAAADIPIFPCVPNSKNPLIPRGYLGASVLESQVDEWWTKWPDANVAIAPHGAGWCVVDLDPGGDVEWAKLLQDHGSHEPTYMVETPRGGQHLYFFGALPSTVSKLAPHVDTRGKGGYVLVPPSIVNGKPYRLLNDRDIAPVPGWVAPLIETADRKLEASTTVRDSPSAVARASSFLTRAVARGDVAIQGQGGDQRSYRMCCDLLGLGVSAPVAMDLLEKIWNPACQPPWDLEALGQKMDNAILYKQNEAGCWDSVSATEAFGRTEAFREVMKVTEKAESRFRMRDEESFDSEPEPAWIVDGLLPEDATVLWVGRTQSFKSFLLLDALLGVATGTETFGTVPTPGLVLYGAIEDLRNVGGSRRRAWKVGRDRSDTPLGWFRASLVPVLGFPGDFDDWCNAIDGWVGHDKLRLLAIDTAGKTLGGLNENASENVRLLWKMCDTLRERFGCTVVAIHHTGKDVDRGARGSSAWDADFDSRILVRRPSDDTKAVEVHVAKHKNAEEGRIWTFEGKPVAGSLVFYPTTQEEHDEMTRSEESDFFNPQKVGKVLAARGAYGRNSAITSPQLSVDLGGALDDESVPRKLDKLAKMGGRAPMRSYCSIEDGVTWWFLPARS